MPHVTINWARERWDAVRVWTWFSKWKVLRSVLNEIRCITSAYSDCWPWLPRQAFALARTISPTQYNLLSAVDVRNTLASRRAVIIEPGKRAERGRRDSRI